MAINLAICGECSKSYSFGYHFKLAICGDGRAGLALVFSHMFLTRQPPGPAQI